jgi:hypothetical protein
VHSVISNGDQTPPSVGWSAASVRHVVLVKAVPGLSADSRERLAVDLQSLVRNQPVSTRATLVPDLGLRPQSPRAADWIATFDFRNANDFSQYLESTAHLDFLTTHRDAMADLLAVQIRIRGSV